MQERRSEVRLLCADMIEVTWLDGHGRSRRAVAVLEDISSGGACLQLETPVEPGTEVIFTSGGGAGMQRMGGMVRYCSYREIGYFVGVQFDDDSRWSPERFEPEHLLDLEKLVQERKKHESS